MQEEDGFPTAECSLLCVHLLANGYEPKFGGFGHQYKINAPKFPEPVNFNFLFSIYALSTSPELRKECLEMSLHTLTKMAYGGIHDHVGQVRHVLLCLDYITRVELSLKNYSSFQGIFKIFRRRWMARSSLWENVVWSGANNTSLRRRLYCYERFVLCRNRRRYCDLCCARSATQGITYKSFFRYEK